MDEFSAAASLAVGAAFTITAYKDEILATLERVDRKFLELLKPLKPYIYRRRHGKKKAKHRFDASQPWSRDHKDGSRYVPDWQGQASHA
jgi:hypothetical protein